MKALSRFVGVVAGALMTLSFAASANLVVDGGFEIGNVPNGSYATYNAVSTMGGWTVTGGSVDLVRGYWQPAPGSSQDVDMAGYFQAGTIQQTILGISADSLYVLSFDMSGNPDGPPIIKTLQVSFGTTILDFTFNTAGITHANMGWQTRAGYFSSGSGGPTVLSFQDVSGPPGAFGAVIDNVSLDYFGPVPEASTLLAGALLLLPFGASTLRMLRRRHLA